MVLLPSELEHASREMPDSKNESQAYSEKEMFDPCGKLHLRLHEANQTSPAISIALWDTRSHQIFAALPAEAQARSLKELLQTPSDADRKASLLQVRLYLKYTQDINDPASVQLRDLLQSSFFHLCNEVTTATSPHCCMLSMQCVDSMLRRHRSLINQNHVEATLRMIATMASPSAPAFTTIHTRHFFIGLCQLFISLLLTHRPKMGMRYHIVAQVLQQLLRCLYTPYLQQHATILSPAWLDRKESRAILDEAELFARMLTMLCNPAPSAVARSRAELNDATKMARDLAGQHLQPVLEQFCSSQLLGSIPPEARTGLMPGIWAVISAMDIVQMRAMNEGFAGAEMRDVWRMVYVEWEKARK